MRFFSRFSWNPELPQQPYGAEVLCSNWVERPSDQPVMPGHAVALERLREADALTFLARIYASQGC